MYMLRFRINVFLLRLTCIHTVQCTLVQSSVIWYSINTNPKNCWKSIFRMFRFSFIWLWQTSCRAKHILSYRRRKTIFRQMSSMSTAAAKSIDLRVSIQRCDIISLLSLSTINVNVNKKEKKSEVEEKCDGGRCRFFDIDESIITNLYFFLFSLRPN